MDDTFTFQYRNCEEIFKTHINSIHEDIKFTSEVENNGSLAFLDSLVKRKPDGSLELTVYRKPTHTDQYLNFNSHHPLHQKLGIVHTLFSRCDKIVTTEQEKVREQHAVKTALKNCGYPEWSLKNKPNRTQSQNDNTTVERKCVVVHPYAQGISEKLSNIRIYRKHNMSLVSKPGTTLRKLLVKPKDKTDKIKTCGATYKIKCQDCPRHYIGETGRQL